MGCVQDFRPLSNVFYRLKLAGNASHILSKPSPTSTLAPLCCPSTESVHSTSFLEVRCWMACAQWQAVIRCSHSWCNFMAIRLPICGTTMMARPTRSGNLASVHTRDSWLSTMMCTPLHSQSGLWRSTGFWVSCGSTAAFGSMPARPRSGTGVAMSPAGAKPSSTKLEPSILTQRSGSAVLIVTRKNVASEFWTLLLAKQSLSGRSWMPPRSLTSCCFSESQQCRTCSQRGFSYCSALHHGRHFICGYVILTTPRHSHDSMTFTLGSVSPRCWGNGMTLSLPLGGTGLAQRTSFSTCRLLGQLGRLLAYYQPTSRRHCPNHVGRPRKPSSLCFSHPGCRVVSSPVGRGRVRLS